MDPYGLPEEPHPRIKPYIVPLTWSLADLLGLATLLVILNTALLMETISLRLRAVSQVPSLPCCMIVQATQRHTLSLRDRGKRLRGKLQVDTTENIGHAQEVQAMDTTLSPEFNRTLRSADEGAIAGATEIDSSLLVESSHDDTLHIP